MIPDFVTLRRAVLSDGRIDQLEKQVLAANMVASVRFQILRSSKR